MNRIALTSVAFSLVCCGLVAGTFGSEAPSASRISSGELPFRTAVLNDEEWRMVPEIFQAIEDSGGHFLSLVYLPADSDPCGEAKGPGCYLLVWREAPAEAGAQETSAAPIPALTGSGDHFDDRTN